MKDKEMWLSCLLACIVAPESISSAFNRNWSIEPWSLFRPALIYWQLILSASVKAHVIDEEDHTQNVLSNARKYMQVFRDRDKASACDGLSKQRALSPCLRGAQNIRWGEIGLMTKSVSLQVHVPKDHANVASSVLGLIACNT